MFPCICCAAEDPGPMEEVRHSSAIEASTGEEQGYGPYAPTGMPDKDEQAFELEAAPRSTQPEVASVPEHTPVQDIALSPESAPGVPEDCTEWEVTIKKTSAKAMVGINLDSTIPSALHVGNIRDGTLITEWNMSHPDKSVNIGDAIMTVNGAADNPSKIVRLREDSLLTIRFRRVSDFIVRMERGNEGLGISFRGLGSGPARIKTVAEGKAVDKYNNSAEPGKAILSGDIVMAVNGVAGDMDHLVDAITRASGTIELKVRHPSRKEFSYLCEELFRSDAPPKFSPSGE